MIDRKAEADATIDFNSLSDGDKVRLGFRQLCRRLLDIDPTCPTKVKGCPFHHAASPMVMAWAKTHPEDMRPPDVQEAVRRMLAANGQGQVCEFPEVKHVAKTYLNQED